MNMAAIMKQAMEMQKKMQQIEQELDAAVLDVSVGGGMIEASMNGRFELTSLRIGPDALKDNDPEMLQDLVLSAVNEAVGRIRKMRDDKMKLAMPVPPGLPGIGPLFS